MNCPNCGKEISDDSRFCSSCGYKLSDAEIAEGIRASRAGDDDFSDQASTQTGEGIENPENPGELDPSVTQVIDDIHTEMGTEDPYYTYRSARAREYREAREAERRSMDYDGPDSPGADGGDHYDAGSAADASGDDYYRGSIEDDYKGDDYRERDSRQDDYRERNREDSYRESHDRDDRRDDYRERDDRRDDYRERDDRGRRNYRTGDYRESRDSYQDPRRRDDRDGFTYEYADSRDGRGGKKKRDGGLIALILILIGVVVVAAVLVLMLIRNHDKAAEELTQVKLDSYLTVELQETKQGSGTYTANATFDSSAFVKKYGDKIVFEGTNSDRKKLAPDAKSDAELLAKSCIQGALDKSEDLTKDDTITFKWSNADEIASKYFGVELVCSDQTYQVSKLIDEMPKVEIATTSSEEVEAVSSSSSEGENPAIKNAENEAAEAVALVWNGSLIGTRDQYNQAKALVDALPDSSEVKKELEDELAQADAVLTAQEEAAKKAAEEEAARKAAEEEAAKKAEEEKKKQEAQNTPQQAIDASGQIFPNSSSQAVSQDQLSGMSADQLQQAINEIYARHGYAFQDANIRAYFEQFSWYNPTVTDMGSISFSQTELDNINRMSAERNAKNGQ